MCHRRVLAENFEIMPLMAFAAFLALCGNGECREGGKGDVFAPSFIIIGPGA